MPQVNRNQQEARAFLCHIWISLACILMAALFFGVSGFNSSFVFVGAFFLVLAILVFTLYFMCFRGHGKEPSCCHSVDGESCCFSCCDSCFRTLFCLGPRITRPASRAALQEALCRRDAANARAWRHSNFVGYDNRAMTDTPNGLAHMAPPMSQTENIHNELRDLETEVNDLLLFWSQVHNRLRGLDESGSRDRSLSRSDRDLADIHNLLGTEFTLLRSWIEDRGDVPIADIQRMRNGLQNLQQRLCLLDNGMRSSRNPMTPEVSTVDAVVGVASLSSPIPPVVLGPVPERQASIAGDQPPPYRECDETSDAYLPVGRFNLIGRPNSDHFRLPYYLTPPVTAPPEDESGAPPSYEEASSSQV